jgi:hypothetical protein
MPAFTYVASVIATSIGAWALGSFGLSVVTGAIATGLAYVTSRIINGNQNKGNNSANTQGGRIQVPPATNNKIPVVYGSAYVNGIITDARLKSSDNTTNDTMYYCLVLSEYTNNFTATPNFGLESVIWNDLRLTADPNDLEKVKDGRKVVNGDIFAAGSFVEGKTYIITKIGTTTQAQWNTIAGTSGQIYDLGAVFTCDDIGTGLGNGEAQEEDFVDTSFVVGTDNLVEFRVYAGGSAAADQIYPAFSTGQTMNAYEFWADNDGSWTNANQMKGLVFAIVKMKYSDKGFTSLPNITFQLANNVANPADVWYDYMTSVRYGAGIPTADIDTTAFNAWKDFCAEDISYTGANLDPDGGAGTTNQVLERYQINGVIDTSNQVKTNIDTILQNGGAWMSYNVATGLWSPVIKKAVSAGVPGDATTYFTASVGPSSNVMTVTAFPNGRIEAGQSLYNSSGTLIGTISAQTAPTAGETAGQIGTYTISVSTTIASTTFYTVAPNLLSFNDDNIISGISISSTRLEDLYNKVEVEFYNKYNQDQKAYYRTSVPNLQLNPNEPVNTLRMNLDLCNNSIQSDLIGQVELRQSRDDLVIEFTSTFYGIQAQAGDIIEVTSDLYGWAPKLFRVMRVKEQETEDGGLVAQIQALEYNPDAYTIESITEFSTAANIGIGNLYSSVGLPAPTNPIITNPNPGVSVPNFTFNVDIPATGGPFDEIEVYYTEGWDQFNITGSIVAGTNSNGAPVGKGLMTLSAVTHNAINAGDYLSISTTGDVVVESQVLPLIGGEVLKGVGRYVVTVANLASLPVSGTTLLYDQPLDSDYIFLKRAVPDGNATVFASPSTVSILIVELPANSQTYRRYFLKSRLGNKKNFGAFSPTAPFDIDNTIIWQPNPTTAGRLADLSDVSITTPTEGDILYYDATGTPKWRNTPILSIDDNGDIGITVNSRKNNRFITESNFTNDSTHPLILTHTSSGTTAVGFGTALLFEAELPTGVSKAVGFTHFKMTDATTGSEDFKFEVGMMKNGVEPIDPPGTVGPQLTLDSLGNLITQGSILCQTTHTAGMYNVALESRGALIITGTSGLLTAGEVKFAIADSHPFTTQTYFLPQAYPAADNYVLHVSNVPGLGYQLSWAADDNTTYGISAETVTGGANLRLTGTNPTTTDNVKIASGTNINVVRTDADTITINSTAGDVVGPASVADNTLAVFNGVTGKLIRASSIWNTGSNLSQIDNISCNSITMEPISTRSTKKTTKSSANGQFLLLSQAASGGDRPAMKVLVSMDNGADIHMCEIYVKFINITTAILDVHNNMYNSFPLATFTATVNPVGDGILQLNATATSAFNTLFTVSYEILEN